MPAEINPLLDTLQSLVVRYPRLTGSGNRALTRLAQRMSVSSPSTQHRTHDATRLMYKSFFLFVDHADRALPSSLLLYTYLPNPPRPPFRLLLLGASGTKETAVVNLAATHG